MSAADSFIEAIPVLKKIHQGGYEAYFVGGCVRDHLLDRVVNDVDIATSATPQEIKLLFKKTVDVGIEHGTVMVLHHGKGYEVTTYRSESTYTDFRRPDQVQFVRSLKEDLKRRDFTINAMAMSVDFHITDLYGGRQDLERRIIRTVGDAKERFSEDALRMLRGARFAAQLSFDIEENTFCTMLELSYLLQHIAVERKRMEMDKLLMGRNWAKGLEYILQAQFHIYLPPFPVTEDRIKHFSKMNIQHLTAEQRWGLVMLPIDRSECESALKSWRLSRKQINYIKKLIDLYNWRTEHSWSPFIVYESGLDRIQQAEQLYAAVNEMDYNESEIHGIWRSLPIKNMKDLDVNGRELVSWSDRSEGPWIGTLFSEIEQAVLEGHLNNSKSEIKKWVKEWHQK
ncbi:CCA tRNA nucleotidyltransferase [Jeotgalibacillus campisalis]|uniref:CCA-adding enzyme n=1 Tax=Jeotgalibacillus campisalis TaxID=220754 RepID=A0A0C2S209_9BACL|nr:CCA tRNA nucleotidyltransferase [Jeotgalibacillus campisalis]KIL48039.1 CCA tRNA nucleotidyltransferase [Jeotgalibacillus campisalis]